MSNNYSEPSHFDTVGDKLAGVTDPNVISDVLFEASMGDLMDHFHKHLREKYGPDYRDVLDEEDTWDDELESWLDK